MAEEESDVSSGQIPQNGSLGYLRGDIRKAPDFRKVVEWTYRLVYTQESIRVLDLRLDMLELCDLRCVGELLEYLGRATERLYDRVRYKDS